MTHLLASDLDQVLDATREGWEEMRGERIFITGATGFFGCWLLETFAWANRRLNLCATATILSRNPEQLWHKAPHLKLEPIEAIPGDVRNFTLPTGTFSHVIHAAAESSTDLNSRAPQHMFDTLVDGTRRCLDFAAKAHTRKFLFVSSGAVYGKQPPELGHIPEDFLGGPDPLDPASAYAEGKRAAELLCVLAARESGLQPKIARCFAFVGPYMKLDAHFAVGNFIRDYLEGHAIRVQGDGATVRSYMYASDLMIWLWTILFRGEPARAYNVGSEDAVSIAALAREVAGICRDESGASAPSDRAGATIPVEIARKAVPGTIAPRYVPSTARARKDLGLTCLVPLRDAIERTIAWNRNRRVESSPLDAAAVSR
jgi:nucleoside-diphosphate-sugar epimerase